MSVPFSSVIFFVFIYLASLGVLIFLVLFPVSHHQHMSFVFDICLSVSNLFEYRHNMYMFSSGLAFGLYTFKEGDSRFLRIIVGRLVLCPERCICSQVTLQPMTVHSRTFFAVSSRYNVSHEQKTSWL